jgi:hypothetical protein
MPNGHIYFNEWYPKGEPNHWTMAQELENERRRLSKALGMIPQIVKEETATTLEEFAIKAELSMAEVLLDNWEDIINLAVENKRLSGEVVILLGQIESMNEQVERMSTAIYTAIESTIRPIRDKRVHDEIPMEEF